MAERRLSADCGHAACQEPRSDDPLAQFCLEPDEIVMSMVGCKLWYEGKQYGQFLFVSGDTREQPAVLERCKQALDEGMARDLGVPKSLQDADWLARFTWIGWPMTRQDWDIYAAMPFDEDTDA